jgi:hypothetical protein
MPIQLVEERERERERERKKETIPFFQSCSLLVNSNLKVWTILTLGYLFTQNKVSQLNRI